MGAQLLDIKDLMVLDYMQSVESTGAFIHGRDGRARVGRPCKDASYS